MIHNNNNCDGSYCVKIKGAVRVLPFPGGNLILCHACFDHEIKFRKSRNRDLPRGGKLDLPDWEDLEIYI